MTGIDAIGGINGFAGLMTPSRLPFHIHDNSIEVVGEPLFELCVTFVLGIANGLDAFSVALGPPTSSGGQQPVAR